MTRIGEATSSNLSLADYQLMYRDISSLTNMLMSLLMKTIYYNDDFDYD